jgi:hypothetical protein
MPILRTNRFHHTTFNKLPVRANFSFDPATPYLAFGQGLYVKTGTRTFAPVGPVLKRGGGAKTTNTGKVKYNSQPISTIDKVNRRVIDPNPAFVHQEQDKTAW